jgi:stage III sporulation protein AD
MLRVLAVAIVTHVCANICRDCGEGTVAGYLEIGGKVEIIALSLPTLKRLIELAVGMI